MKSLFEDYLPYSSDELSDIWSNALFVFDTNTLLNFYRYSNDTADSFREALSLYAERIWIPKQVGIEYFKNRLTVLNKEVSKYNDAEKSFNEIKTLLGNRKGHPFISSELLERFEKIHEEVLKDFSTQKSNLQTLITSDNFITIITDLFNGKVGDGFSEDELIEIYKEGKKRYEQKIPPGFGDAKDKPEPDRYGDLILWKELLIKAKADNTNVIFVSDEEQKGDWVLSNSGKNLGPLPALRKEFREYTGKKFYIYPAFRFLTLAFESNQKLANPTAIQEIKEISKSDNKIDKISGLNFIEVTSIFAIKDQDIKSFDFFCDEISRSGYHLNITISPDQLSALVIVNLPFHDLIRRFREHIESLLIKHDNISLSFFSVRN